MEELNELVKELVAAIARSTALPLIEWDEKTNHFVVQISANDQGRMIGKSGVTIAAINVVMWYAGLLSIKKAVGIRLLEPRDQKREAVSVPFIPKDSLDLEELHRLASLIVKRTILGAHDITFASTHGQPTEVKIAVPKKSKAHVEDPDLVTALKAVLKTIGRACGGVVEVSVHFTK